MKKNGEKKNSPELKKDDEQQSRRFVETAESLGFDKSGRSFSKLINSIKQDVPDSKTEK